MPRLPSSPALLLSKNARKVILALKQQQKSFATAEAAIEISLPPSSTPSSSSSNSAVNNSNVSTTIPMAKPPAQNKPVFPSSSSLPVIPSFAPVPVSLEVFYERVAMIHAFISTGDIFRAEIVFHRLFRSNKLELKRHADTRIFNAFIEGYLQSSVQCEIPKYQVARALEWFDRISAMGFAPTQETYAILLLHFCGKDDLEQVEKYVTMAQQASIDTLNILNDDRFIDSPAARSTLEVVLRKLDVDVDNYIPTDDFLLSVLDEKRIDLTVNSWSARQGDSSSSLVETDVSSASTTMLASSNSNSPAINRNAVIAYDSTSNDHAATSANKGGIGAATILDKKHMDIERNAQEFANIKKTKSLGVNLLARTLQKLAESHDIDAASKYKQQEWLEEESVRMANEQSTDNIAHDNIHFLNHMPKKLLQKWFAQIMPIIKTEIKNMKQSNYTSQAHVPFMKLLKPEQLTLIAISEFMKVPKKREIDTLGDVKAVSILVSIGKSVQSEANANYIKRKRNQKSVNRCDNNF